MKSVSVFKVDHIINTKDAYVRVESLEPLVIENVGHALLTNVKTTSYQVKTVTQKNYDEDVEEASFIIADPAVENAWINMEHRLRQQDREIFALTKETDMADRLWRDSITLIRGAKFRHRLRYLFTGVLTQGI